jgi:hypothetical protein
MKYTKHTVASLGQGDEGSENGIFEDPFCSPLASMAWTMPIRGHTRVRADASVLPPGSFITDAIVRPSHGQPCGHRPTIHPSVIVHVTTLPRCGELLFEKANVRTPRVVLSVSRGCAR